MNKIGWKVVHKTSRGKLLSAVISNPRWCQTYIVGKQTKGYASTPVLAFSTRQQARDFKTRSLLVFKAQLRNPRSTFIADWCHSSDFVAFWKNPELYEWRLTAPDGTLACDAITLLERA